MDRRKTHAERTREKSLLDDPLALVLSPSYVECRQCNRKIKLSSKSAFDTFHWRNHRARCVKMAKKRGKATTLSHRPASILMKIAMSASPRCGSRNFDTPPVVDISDGKECRSEPSPEAQPPPSTVSSSSLFIQFPSDIRPSEADFDDYVLRSHPDCSREVKPLSDRWQTWSWSRLSEPRFPAPIQAHYGDEAQDDDNDVDHCGCSSRTSPLLELDELAVQDAAYALSSLAHSH